MTREQLHTRLGRELGERHTPAELCAGRDHDDLEEASA